MVEQQREQQRVYERAYMARPGNKEKKAAARRVWAKRPEVMERHRALKKAWYQRPEAKEHVRNHRREKNYGLTKEAYEALLQSQGGVCAICGGTDWGHRGPNIDHNHDNGAVRGILCMECNLAIGILHDDVCRAGAAMNYLEKYNRLETK